LHRPKYVSDAIAISPEGLHTGTYGPLTLRAAYQPIFRLDGRDLRLCAWEGLVRAFRGDEAVPPPELFAYVEHGDHLFVECMCRALHLRNYEQANPFGLDLFINVNPAIYESVEVIEREFEFMFSILAKYGLRPELLVCELVEQEALSEDALTRLCAKFRAYGARIALDDFGSGSSAGPRYRAIQPDVVKVDGTMFRQLCATSGGRRMLGVIAGTFLRDGATLLVEGIEDRMHLNVAADIGARLLQGYGLARPQLLPWAFDGVPHLSPSPEPYVAIA
jgi:EAL domain-containing protein (putative c-di-GMP-specific phosphodiesterase class I)